MKEIIHTIQGTIISNKEFNELFNTNLNNIVYKRNICELNQTTIKASILKRIDILSRLTLDSRNYYYDEELKGYEVAVDETKFRKRTRYSIHMSKLHQVNYFNCTEGKQELQNATYQEILHVLKEFLLDKAIIFIIDRKVAIDIIENLPKTQKER
jgi:hypothetical protein